MTARWLFLCLAPCLAIAPGSVARAADPAAAPDAVARALGRQGYPWYDQTADRLKPVSSEDGSILARFRNEMRKLGRRLGRALDRMFDALGRFFRPLGKGVDLGGAFSIGQMLGTAVLFGLLVLVVAVLFRLWRRADSPGSTTPALEAAGGLARLANVPLGTRATPAELWRLALECRANGDLSGAVVAVFAYQLVALERKGLLRFAPGRTARHYVRDLKDDRIASLLGRSLALFEQVYYGGRRPSAQAFERVWAEVERFQQSALEGKP